MKTEIGQKDWASLVQTGEKTIRCAGLLKLAGEEMTMAGRDRTLSHMLIAVVNIMQFQQLMNELQEELSAQIIQLEEETGLRAPLARAD